MDNIQHLRFGKGFTDDLLFLMLHEAQQIHVKKPMCTKYIATQPPGPLSFQIRPCSL